MIEITEERYNALLKKEYWLDCLEFAGVDNWGGIDYAYDLMEREYPEDGN